MTLTERLHGLARERGAASTGVCDAAPFDEVAITLRRRVDDGLHGGLGFTYADPDVSTDPAASFPWARRLFVAGWSYLPDAGSPGPSATGTVRVARFATEDHYAGLRGLLGEVATTLRADGHRAEVLVDDNRLVDRAAAVRAGVGWWGKNTMVLAPGVGPWMLLGSVVTDAPLDLSEEMTRDCGTCDACLPACPTGALVSPGVLDAGRCLAAVLQQSGAIPRHLRQAVGDRLYGCDDCLDACPPGGRLMDASVERIGRHDVYELLALDDERLLARFAHFYVPKRRATMLRRNALVVIGNTGDHRDVAMLAGFLGHPLSVLREHAAWAIGRIGGPDAMLVLERAARHETDGAVANEIVLALETVDAGPSTGLR